MGRVKYDGMEVWLKDLGEVPMMSDINETFRGVQAKLQIVKYHKRDANQSLQVIFKNSLAKLIWDLQDAPSDMNWKPSNDRTN